MSTRRAGNTSEFSTCVSNASHRLAHSRHSKNICGHNKRIQSDNVCGKGLASMKRFLAAYVWSPCPQGTCSLDPASAQHRFSCEPSALTECRGRGIRQQAHCPREALERHATPHLCSTMYLPRFPPPNAKKQMSPLLLKGEPNSIFSESWDMSASSS